VRKAPRSLVALITKILGRGAGKSERARHRLLARPTQEDVLHGFRFILGRELEDEGAIKAHMNVATVTELRDILLRSDEFSGKYKSMCPDALEHPIISMERRTVVFVHLLKTGGTSLRVMLGKQFPDGRKCPVLEDKLHLLSIAELAQYDFFSGHFDISAIRFIPRDDIEIVALFREPRARLISLYRFLKSHPLTDEFANDSFIRLAHRSTAEEFFENPQLRLDPRIRNHYLFALGRSFAWFDQNKSSLSTETLSQVLQDAKSKIRALTALGITERFDHSVQLIWKSLRFPPPSWMEKAHVTDKFAENDSRFRRVEPVRMTPRLATAMEDLVAYDDILYQVAVKEFDRRFAEIQSFDNKTTATFESVASP
jgi:hypothetical protein